eukprot:g2714.t1
MRIFLTSIVVSVIFRVEGSGCVQDVATDSLVPSTVYTISNVTTTSYCEPFEKVLIAYGMIFAADTAGQTVPENALKWLAHLMAEMFPSSVDDLSAQETVLENMYKYKAANPVFYQTMVDDMSPAKDYVSMCDTITIAITDNVNDQFIEIWEHVLHIISGVGLSKTFPSKWGISTSSDLYAAMQEAIMEGAFDDSDYDRIDSEGRLHVKLQEFAYWGLSTVYGVHEAYGSDASPEWTLNSASEVHTRLPLFSSLHNATTARFMTAPSAATSTQLGNLASGGSNADEAPWPVVSAGRSIASSEGPAVAGCGAPSSASADDDDDDDDDDDNMLAIGIGIGMFAFILVCAAGICFYACRTRK